MTMRVFGCAVLALVLCLAARGLSAAERPAALHPAAGGGAALAAAQGPSADARTPDAGRSTPLPAAAASPPAAAVAPAWDWKAAAPESAGFSAEKLAALKQRLAAQRTKAWLVIRNDAIVQEWYAPDFSPTSTHYTASMAKAIVGGVSLAVAMSDGRLRLDDPACKFIPQWKNDPRKSRITLRQLGSHASGLADAEADGLPHEKLTGWQGGFWKHLAPPQDPFTISRDLAPLLTEPGQKWAYSNPGIGMLTYAVTAALRDAPEKDVRTLLATRIMRPIGVPDDA
ncbi:MAG: beta-lactamase family protein [Planctomycetes bacterium]|nr:beta-lactamase family protein [Planctomycetota bacterium]